MTGSTDRFAQAWAGDRTHPVDLAYRVFGDVGDAQDVVQEGFARLARTAPGEVEDPRGWLTVVVGRLCLDQVRSARVRRERVAGVAMADGAVPLTGAAEPDALLAVLHPQVWGRADLGSGVRAAARSTRAPPPSRPTWSGSTAAARPRSTTRWTTARCCWRTSAGPCSPSWS